MNYSGLAMLRMACSGIIGVLALVLSGCGSLFGPDGYFRDRGDDYLKAETTTPIQLRMPMRRCLTGLLCRVLPVQTG